MHVFNNLRANSERALVILFFAVFLAAGLLLFKDYGVAWDEDTCRTTGIVTYNYLAKGDESLFMYMDRYYGPVYELLLVVLEKVFYFSSTRDIFFMRHLVNFLFFFIAVIFFYKLAKYRFKNSRLALLGCLFLALSPRIFADSFYNPKDLPFLSGFIIAMYTTIKYINSRSVKDLILHSFVSGLVTDIRIMGVMIPFFTVIFSAAGLLDGKDIGRKTKETLARITAYLALTAVFVVLFWPFLWRNPFVTFANALDQMAHFERWKYDILYMGGFINAYDTPWHYIPVWIAISTPFLYLVFFAAGYINAVISFIKNPVRYILENRDDVMFILWFTLPIFAVNILNSVLYDGWRQLFFIYPALLLFTLSGITQVYEIVVRGFFRAKEKAVKSVFAAIIAFFVFQIFYRMIALHPFENLYFNFIAGKNLGEIKQRFELDYWGLSYRKALEYITANDKDEEIYVCVSNQSGAIGAYILPPEDMGRLIYVRKPEDADYFVSNYRWHKEDYDFDNEVYSYVLDGAKIAVVYKINGQSK